MSTKKINESFPNISGNFDFQEVSREDVKKETINLRQCVEVCLPLLTKAINQTITENIFPEHMKKPKVIPLYKKENPLKNENYRPMTLLPHASQIFEKIIFK